MSAADASSLSLWSALSLLGLILVIVGVVMEGAEAFIWTTSLFRRKRLSLIWSEPPEPHIPRWAHRLDHVGWFILVIGLALETWGHIRVTDITGRENRRLTAQLDLTTRETSQAKERAVIAEREAGQANERASTNELQVEWLKSNNLVLEKKVIELRMQQNPRFANFDWDIFVKALQGKPKKRIDLLYQKDDVEAFQFAQQIENGLIQAGWTVSKPRPMQEQDIPTQDYINNLRQLAINSLTNAPLLFRAGAGWNSLVFEQSLSSAKENALDESKSAFGALHRALRMAGVNTSGASTWGSNVPDDLIRIIIGQKY